MRDPPLHNHFPKGTVAASATVHVCLGTVGISAFLREFQLSDQLIMRMDRPLVASKSTCVRAHRTGRQRGAKKKAETELRNVKSFTRSKSSKQNFTQRKTRKSRQILHLLLLFSYFWKQKLNVLSYNPCLKTEFHICCSNLHKTILDFAKLCILPDFLPQTSNFFTRIYPPYP